MSVASEFETALAALDAQQLLRRRRVVTPIDGARVVVDGVERLAFCSNDYLGLAQHRALIEATRAAALRHGVGAGASPLVSGHSPEHAALEAELAAFVGLPRALYFYAGYAANSGCIPALVGPGDALIADALNHACLIDGARLSGAERHIVPHGNLAALERALIDSRAAQRRLVVADAVFSMDGDVAPIPQMLALCERHDALLYLDDAHGFGVLGRDGRGVLSHVGLVGDAVPERLIYMATLGKAAGVSGAFVAGAAPVIEWLMQKARTYMFATGAPAMVAAACRAGLRVIEAEGWRRDRLAALRTQLQSGLATLPWHAPATPSAIQPLLLGSNEHALQVMAALDAQGLWVPAIRPPTVPAGTARLRITLSAAHCAADVARLLAALRTASKS